ncbi:MAG TPA: hypothetical protein DGG94_01880 [Micromonosporaceae bacterium]|nr:hypothetical protein [Micromonosporaceae bacterium]HCU48577.1 hypothetical protein [Micromonosporaceae bacterium]
MQSRARFLGHAIHPVLVVFPLGLYTTAVIFDVIRLITDRAGFAPAAGYTMGIGVIGGVLAGVIGFVDWFAIPKGTRARKVGLVHGVGNVAVNVLFGVSWLLRMNSDNWVPGAAALVCSFAGLALAGFTGWLGGELVERLAVSVDEDANINAKSSLA